MCCHHDWVMPVIADAISRRGLNVFVFLARLSLNGTYDVPIYDVNLDVRFSIWCMPCCSSI